MSRDPTIELVQGRIYKCAEQVLRYRQLIAELELAGCWNTARSARKLLARVMGTLDKAKARLERRRAAIVQQISG